MKYDLDLSMPEDGLMRLSLIDKSTGQIVSFEHSSYSYLMDKGYSHLLKELKKEGIIKTGKK